MRPQLRADSWVFLMFGICAHMQFGVTLSTVSDVKDVQYALSTGRGEPERGGSSPSLYFIRWVREQGLFLKVYLKRQLENWLRSLMCLVDRLAEIPASEKHFSPHPAAVDVCIALTVAPEVLSSTSHGTLSALSTKSSFSFCLFQMRALLFLITLLRYNSHTVKFTLLKYINQCFFQIYTRLCHHYHYVISEYFRHP